MTDEQSDQTFDAAMPIVKAMMLFLRMKTTPDVAIVALALIVADTVNNILPEEGATTDDVLNGFMETVKTYIGEFNKSKA